MTVPQSKYRQLGEDARFYQDSIAEVLRDSDARLQLEEESLKALLGAFHTAAAIEEVAALILEGLQKPAPSLGFRARPSARTRRRFFNPEGTSHPPAGPLDPEEE